MPCLIELRYVVPPVINLVRLFLTFQGVPWNQDGASGIDQNPMLVVPFFVLALCILLFLCTSIQLIPGARPIPLNRYFSGPLTISLLASLILPPRLFCVAYFLLIVTSPWYAMFLNLFKRFFQWLYQTLRTIPAIIVICITQPQQNLQIGPPEPEVVLDIESGTM